MRVLGVSAFYHDSAAALVEDGRIIAAAQQERFSRRKHDPGFPTEAIAYCLREARCTLAEVDRVVFYDKPFLKFERLLETYLAFAPRGLSSFCKAMPAWIREKLFQKDLLGRELKVIDEGFETGRLLFAEHHFSHAASAFFPSPFREAAVLTMDGVGEWATTSVALGHDTRLEIIKELHFPHSLGLLYSSFTHYTGFKVNGGEYKVMGLAPYGEPRYAPLILDRLMDLKPDGSFRLDMRYFDYCTGLTMTNRRFEELFGQPVRRPDGPLGQFHMDVAASIQAVTEEVVLRLTRSIAAETGMRNLCLAGGVALNCVANGRVLRDGRFADIWIQPAAGDAGGALGAALIGYHQYGRGARTPDGRSDAMSGAYLGPAFGQPEIERRLRAVGAHFDVAGDDAITEATASALAAGKVVGWVQGRMEFGPRALGARSILADPRSPAMQRVLNEKIKQRENFRPFAPAVLREDLADWFELDVDSPYMLLVAQVHHGHRQRLSLEERSLKGLSALAVARSTIPAVTHVDCSARVQTVHAETNPRFHALLIRFKALTGCPVLVNTSFNVRGEPVVCTPEEAFRCFMGTDLDALVVGNCFLDKAAQPPSLRHAHATAFDAD
ncbi:MAG: carbamoyltransferase [Rhodospirillales bacterium]|nr:carbamoyltransferase [Rhodospirillales bacterium]